MSEYVLLNMWEPYRQSLIGAHQFYVEQARKRLLAQFEDIETEADLAAEEWLQRGRVRFDPDRDDPADFYEAANDAGIEFYGLLSEMRDQTRLGVVTGLFHEWEKRLRDWLAREIQHWRGGNNAATKVWSAEFGQIVDLLESFGWKICSAAYFSALDACRLVVNVHKHGKGRSLDELKQKYPQYLDDPFSGSGGAFSNVRYRDHTHLKVNDDQFQAFGDAIVAFWKEAPENVFDSHVKDVPDWFGEALVKSGAGRRQRGKE